MVFFKAPKPSQSKDHLNFSTILKEINITFENIPKNKCDERTLYVTMSISHNQEKVAFDLIFLLDRPQTFGAISINEQYEKVRNFFVHHFNYTLNYEDEIVLGKRFMETNKFKEIYLDITSKSENEKRPHDKKRAVS